MRRKVLPATSVPTTWPLFLRADENKADLFTFLADEISSNLVISFGKSVVITRNENDVGINFDEATFITPCSHEEADTRLLLHVADMARAGHERIAIRTVDSNVVILANAMLHHLNINELWILFGSGKSYRYLPIHLYVAKIGNSKVEALLFFHAITGCDTVSTFHGKGKKSAWEV